MKPLQTSLFAVILVVAGFVVFLALRSRQPPVLPADAEHAAFTGAAACLTCHGPAGSSPQSKNHPLGDDCLRCHGRP